MCMYGTDWGLTHAGVCRVIKQGLINMTVSYHEHYDGVYG